MTEVRDLMTEEQQKRAQMVAEACSDWVRARQKLGLSMHDISYQEKVVDHIMANIKDYPAYMRYYILVVKFGEDYNG